ncbi:gamma interferon inducible lysosomal thiol reductase-domain-containing protein [Phaeosphaeriaceae sp. PMI808]|nr:gamma interferon inducible lysosomal thiol reductase-domain-containing protein [Phaeosphaeriaceae sp. PMI808]
MRQKRKSRFQAAALVILFAVFWLARSWTCDHEHIEADSKVPLDVHIMSKCPDARACLKKLVVPTMADVSDKVDFRLSFIGQTTEEDDGVQCKHGQTECLGNMLMLCAAAEYPDPKLYLGFSNCLINDYQEIPNKSLIEDCALEHGLDFDTLNNCMSKDTGAYGMGLLRDSVQHSAQVGVTTSCTIRLNEKVRCVYDDGEWKECDDGSNPEDLIRDIKRLYDEAQGWTY